MTAAWTRSALLALCAALALPGVALAQNKPAAGASAFTLPEPTEPLDIRMSTLKYPHPVQFLDLTLEGKALQMAYMDVPAAGKPNGQTIVLLHGGLGFGLYWGNTITALTQAGWRVVVPDQIGFGKSSKEVVRYSMQQWSRNTRMLLDKLGVKQSAVLGHSMGGMMAVRYALMYPEAVSKLVLENPLGLEDYRLVIPFKSVDDLTATYLKATWEGTQKLHASTYAKWDPKYAENAKALYRITKDPEFPKVAHAQATIQSVMLSGDPILYELKNIQASTLLVWGEKDTTTPGKGYASPEIRPTLGNFAKLTAHAATQIPKVQVKMIPGVAHVPHLEDSARFHAMVVEFLAAQ